MLDSMSDVRDSVDCVQPSMNADLDPLAANHAYMKAANEPVSAVPSARSAVLDLVSDASRLAARSRASESGSGRIESPNQELENGTRCSLLADLDVECRATGTLL
jgi:predicted ester cyclase